MILGDQIRDLLKFFGLFNGRSISSNNTAFSSIFLNKCFSESGLLCLYDLWNINNSCNLSNRIEDDLNCDLLVGAIKSIDCVDMNIGLLALLNGNDLSCFQSFSGVYIDYLDKLVGNLSIGCDFIMWDRNGDNGLWFN